MDNRQFISSVLGQQPRSMSPQNPQMLGNSARPVSATGGSTTQQQCTS